MPRHLSSVRAQYHWLRRSFPEDVLFFQVGRFFELYGSADTELARWLGLAPLAANRRQARYGFPFTLARVYARRLLRAGRTLLIAEQTEQAWTHIRERRITWRLVPRAALALQEL